MVGIIGKKIGMTSVFQEDGRNIQVTVIEAGPCAITQIKTEETDGYNALQLAYGERTEKHTTKALGGHFKKSGTDPKRKLIEFRNFDVDQLASPVTAEGEEPVAVSEKGLGAEIFLGEVCAAGDYVDITGRSKGKGFQGVVRRHGFAGVGMATHGQHNRGRAPGSIGNASTPSKVFKGMRMAGRMGHDRVTTKNLEVIQVMPDKNLLLVKGSVPGPKGGYLIIKK